LYFDNYIPLSSFIELVRFENEEMKHIKDYVREIDERLGPSLSGDLLIKNLQDHYGKEYFYNIKVTNYLYVNFLCDYELDNDEFYKTLLNFFNFKSKRIKNSYSLEPQNSPSADDLVWKVNKGICYHITSKYKLDKILKTELTPKSVENIYDGRIYVFSETNENKVKEIASVFLRLKYRLNNKENNNNLDKHPVLIKINLNNKFIYDTTKELVDYPIFYYDTAFQGAKAVYTERIIPKECFETISELT
jgi:hypothetical protein